MTPQHQIPSTSFQDWIFKVWENRLLLVLSSLAVLIQIVIFKYFYPFPNFLPDSYSYLEAAFENQSINMWPIGYSKFLRLVSSFTDSHTALTVSQYLLLQGSMLYLLFSIAYLLRLGKWTLRVLFCCGILNPLLLHVSNFVSSDALFATLSLVWFTQLLWILCKPGWPLILIHASVLLVAFTVRYNALYYPFISVLTIAISQIHIREKLTGIAVITVLIGAFISQTFYQYHIITGTRQFSAFGGWQLASNALFAYAHTSPTAPNAVPTRFRQLHTIVNKHSDSLRQVKLRPDTELGIYYLWDEQAPLKKYMHNKYRKDSVATDGFKQWASMGPLYAQYGRYLIQQHPDAFVRYYLWPNTLNYYSPPAEFLGIYNMGKDTIESIANVWFGVKSNKVYSLFKDNKITIATFISVLLTVINLVFIVSFISFLLLGGLKKTVPLFKKILWLMLLVWVCNAGFSILASPIVLRYQVFPMVSTGTFMVLLVTFIIQESRSVKINPKGYRDQNVDPVVSI